MIHHEELNYVEFAAKELPATKAFFQSAFTCVFTDYGLYMRRSQMKAWMAVL